MNTYTERRLDLNYLISVRYSLMKRRAIKKNLEICSKEEFKEFAFLNEKLKKLHNDWIDYNFDIKKSPSIDRIDNSKGYIIGNMQFITHSENVSKGNIETKTGKSHFPTRQRKVKLEKDSEEYLFENGKQACDFLGYKRSAVCISIKNNTLLKGFKVSYESRL